jgi:hypothetical protein
MRFLFATLLLVAVATATVLDNGYRTEEMYRINFMVYDEGYDAYFACV